MVVVGSDKGEKGEASSTLSVHQERPKFGSNLVQSGIFFSSFLPFCLNIHSGTGLDFLSSASIVVV